MKILTHLSLFSGIGGLDLATEWAGIQTVGQCEWAEYPTQVLEKHWPDVPRWKDIRTLTGESFYERTGRRTVDIISGGFPCQPFSVAGKQRGKEDDRYLWPEMVRVIKELRPTWVVGENVAGIVRMALPDILSELEACGYRTRTFLIPACAVGARHRRYRVAIAAHSDSGGQLYRQNEIKSTKRGKQAQRELEQCCENVGDSEHNGLSSAAVAGGTEKAGRRQQERKEASGESEGTSESRNGKDMGRAENMENPSCRRCGKQGNVYEQPGRTESERAGETMAYAESQSEGRLSGREKTEKPRFGSSSEDVQYPDSTGREEQHVSAEPDKEGVPGRRCDAGDVCNTTGEGLQDRPIKSVGGQRAQEQELERPSSNVPDTDDRRRDVRRDRELSTAEEAGRKRRNIRERAPKHEPGEWRTVESILGGVADGIPTGMDGYLDFIINHYWDEEPDIPRIATGIEHRVDRLKCLGNAVVPQQFYPIFRAISEITEQTKE